MLTVIQCNKTKRNWDWATGLGLGYAKWQRGVMGGSGGVVVHTRWLWWWGCAIAKCEGVVQKNWNWAIMAQFWARHVKQRQQMVRRGGVVVCMRWLLAVGSCNCETRGREGFGPRPKLSCVKWQWRTVVNDTGNPRVRVCLWVSSFVPTGVPIPVPVVGNPWVYNYIQ